jgi:hypothetical protein
MKKILEGVTRITTRIDFDLLNHHIDTLICEATEGGYFSDPDESNEYTKEIARLGKIGARYEDEFLNLSINRKPREFIRKKAGELVGVA